MNGDGVQRGPRGRVSTRVLFVGSLRLGPRIITWPTPESTLVLMLPPIQSDDVRDLQEPHWTVPLDGNGPGTRAGVTSGRRRNRGIHFSVFGAWRRDAGQQEPKSCHPSSDCAASLRRVPLRRLRRTGITATLLSANYIERRSTYPYPATREHRVCLDFIDTQEHRCLGPWTMKVNKSCDQCRLRKVRCIGKFARRRDP